ncbi:MAG: peptidoglycan-binding domain-containing protein [Acidimicrobiales bacterium]
MRRVVPGLLSLVFLFVLVAGCGDDKAGSSSTTTTLTSAATTSRVSPSSTVSPATTPPGPSVPQAGADELKIWQQNLSDVGCNAGVVDGLYGPQTHAAIKAFQQAKGLVADGVLGPKTKEALSSAVAAKERVCAA